MPKRSVPSVRRLELGRELRRLREVAGLTGEAAVAHLSWSSAKVSRIETAHSPIEVSDLERLLSLYGATSTEADRLRWLARTAEERGWWELYANLPSEYASYIGLEAGCIIGG